MRICDDLRQAVLQAAIQGKLTKQLPEDGNAADLLNQIAVDKEKLVKEGKIKKEKPLPGIAADEIPFDIPDNWKWCHLGNAIKEIIVPQRDKPPFSSNGIIPWCRIEDRDGNFLHGTKSNQYVSKETIDKMNLKVLPVGTVLTACTGGSIGTIVINTKPCCTNQTFNGIVCGNKIHNWYVFWFLVSKFQELKTLGSGTTIAYVSQDKTRAMLFPLPPLAEQQRIVAKVEELMARIDDLEKTETELEKLKAAFPSDLKTALLQAAMQGKLTEQLPEDGDVADLLNQIVKEKNQLIKEGKIKKEKPLPTITPDEVPFDIPDNWQWIRLGVVFNIINGFTPLKSNPEFWNNGDVPWFTIDDIHKQGRFINHTEKYINRKALSSKTERIVPPNTVLLCCTASVGEYAFTNIALTTNQQFNALVVKKEFKSVIFPLYAFEYAKTLKSNLIRKAGKTTFNFISVGKLSQFLIPLPPLAEQKRIVEKLDKLLPLCDGLVEE